MNNMPNMALLSDKFSAALQICRKARRYTAAEKTVHSQKNHN